jgi:hypothetical protein
LGTGRGEGKWRDVPYGECGVKKLERKEDEDLRKNRNAFCIPLLWLRLSASSASCVAGYCFWQKAIYCAFWLWLLATAASCACRLWLLATAASCTCRLWLLATAASCTCRLWLLATAASCACRPWLLATAAARGCCQLLLAALLIKGTQA